MKTKLTHAGILLKRALDENGITPYRAAKETGIAQSTMTKIVNGQRPITVDVSLRLSRYLKVSPQFFLNLQINYDLRKRSQELDKELSWISPHEDAA